MKFRTVITAAAALTLATAAQAQIGPEEGATVFGPNGDEVGTIESVQNGLVVVNTGSNTGSVPADVFGEGPDGPIISVTKMQLDQLLENQQARAQAERDSALVTGATVLDANGVEVGTVSSIEGDNAVVDLGEGEVALARNQFATDANGALMARVTQAQLMATLNGEAAPAADTMMDESDDMMDETMTDETMTDDDVMMDDAGM